MHAAVFRSAPGQDRAPIRHSFPLSGGRKRYDASIIASVLCASRSGATGFLVNPVCMGPPEIAGERVGLLRGECACTGSPSLVMSVMRKTKSGWRRAPSQLRQNLFSRGRHAW